MQQLSAACCAAQVRETVRDVKLLHNEQFFAAAQKKYVYIYDKRGLEVHCLKVRLCSMPQITDAGWCMQLAAIEQFQYILVS